MQALCQWDVQRAESVEELREFIEEQGAPEAAGRYATELVEAVWSRREQVDERIAAASRAWELTRISPVERNVMRVAVVELLDEKVPPKVALNEAIEIGREYGGAESPRFINGVLDEVLTRTRQAGEGDG